MKRHRYELTPCFGCGKPLKAAAQFGTIGKGKRPKDCLSICLYCGHITMCDEHGKPIRELTVDETLSVVKDPKIVNVQRMRMAFMDSVYRKPK
jgi:hypothetical protein